MKKKFTGMLICLLMVCMTLFAGCSLVEVDSDKYYNSVVAEIKDKEGKEVIATITSEDLINGYQSYGYYYEYYYGMTKEEAVEETIKLLQNRKITLIEAEKKFNVDKTGKNLTDLEKTYIWEQVASTLQANLDYYYDEIVGEGEEKTEEESGDATFEDYTKSALLSKDENGNFIIKETAKNEGVLDSYVPSVSNKDYNKEADRKLIFENFRENNKYGKHFEAYTKYFTNLKAAEQGKKLSTNERDVFEREIAKIYDETYENYVITKYTEALLEKDGVSSIEVQDILDLYSSKVRSSYTQYAIEGDSAYSSNMQNDPTTIYYYTEGQEATKFFSVANILFNKAEGQEGKYELIVRSDDDGDGVYYEESSIIVSKADIYSFIQSNVTNVISSAQNSNSSAIVGDAIKECVYKYNQDPGMLSATANYYIGVDSEGKAVSNFVEEFNEAGLALYNNGEGVVGNIEITESDFGIHVLVYTGAYENLFQGIDHKFALTDEEGEEGQLAAIEVLNTTRVSPMLDKTLFDVLYDELYVDNSSSIQQADMDVLRAQYSFTTYSGRIPDALK